MIDSKIMLLGFGGVARSLFNLILKEGLFSIDKILVADRSRKALRAFESMGGKKENGFFLEMDSHVYTRILDLLEEGDYLMCLSEGNDSLILSKECAGRGIHFLCTTDDTFSDKPFTEPFRYRTHFYSLKDLMKKTAGKATSVLQFGSNPGLINLITKKALMEIVEGDEGDFVEKNRERLKDLVSRGEFARLASELKVTAFVEADLDTTESDYDEDDETAYSTWSIADFFEEMNDRSMQMLGSGVSLSEHLKRLNVSADQVFYYNKYDGTLVLDLPGKQVKTGSFSKELAFTGYVDAHEEIFSIHDYYTLRNEAGEIEYAPSVMFVYKPCDIAIRSIYHDLNRRSRLITKDRMTGGGETIGMCVEGENFRPIYVGIEVFYDKDSFETPTVLMVSASVFAAILYMEAHPKEGVVFPEYLDTDEVLESVRPWIPLVTHRMRGYNG